MKVKIKITARLINPPGVWEDEVGAEIPDPSYQQTAVNRAIHTILAGGGLYRVLDEGATTQFIPMLRVEDINVTLSTVALADNLDLAKATGGRIIP
jgi:hypothetical protein